MLVVNTCAFIESAKEESIARRAPKEDKDPQPARKKARASTSANNNTASTASANAPDSGRDVLTMDAGSLQDVVQYAGIDLKAESEMIMTQVEHSLSTRQQPRRKSRAASSHHHHQQQQHRTTLATPLPSIQHLLKTICKHYGIRKIESDVEHFLWLAVLERINALLNATIQASWKRVELGRDVWQLDLIDGLDAFEDQPQPLGTGAGAGAAVMVDTGRRSRIGAVRRPLVWLEKFEKTREARLALEMKGSVSEEGQMAYLAAGGDAEDGDTEHGTGAAGAGTGGEGGTGGDKKKDKDDVIVRARLTNAAAMRAVGLDSKYSWMTSAAAPTPSAALIAPSGLDSSTATSPTNASHPPSALPRRDATAMGGFGLPRAEQRYKTLSHRKITVADVMFALRWDPTREAAWGKIRRTKAVQNAVLHTKL